MPGWYKHILVIEPSIWRNGFTGEFRHGGGSTLLLNPQGFMCCLGQACLALGARPAEVLGLTSPGMAVNATGIRKSYLIDMFGNNSEFARAAMDINDSSRTSRSGKELALFMLGKKHGIYVKFTGTYLDGLKS